MQHYETYCNIVSQLYHEVKTTMKKSNNNSITTSSSEVSNQSEFKLSKYNVNEKSVFLSLILSLIVDMLGFSLTLPLLPSIAEGFGATAIWIGVITSANAITSLIFGPIWGKLSDKYGRKPILLISQAGTLAAFVLLASSNSLTMILIARLLDGIFGGQFPIIQAIVSDITTPDNRSEKMGKVMIAVTLSTFIGPMMGGILGGLNWRIPPLVTAGLGVISIILTTTVLIETMPKERREDLRKERELQGKNEKTPIFNSQTISRFAQIFLMNVIFVMYSSIGAIIMDDRYQMGPTVIGIVMSVMFVLGAVVGGGLLKPAQNTFGIKILMFISVGSGVLAWALFPALSTLWSFFIFLILLVVFQGFMRPLTMTNITKAVPADRQGEVSGWTSTIQSIAQSAVPLIATGFLEIGSIQIVNVAINSYALIGVFTVIVGIILGIIVWRDSKKHPDAFKMSANVENERKKIAIAAM